MGNPESERSLSMTTPRGKPPAATDSRLLRYGKRRFSAALALLLCTIMTTALADRDGQRSREPARDHARDHVRDRDHRQYDTRHHHNRYYPALGVVVDLVPRGFHEVPYQGTRYFFQGGVWYRSQGSRFVVVTPPTGLTLSVLPPFYTTVWAGGSPYFYADGVYYAWRPVQQAYVVVEPPRASEVLSLPPEVALQFVYPKKGQSEQQQAQDRYECHQWAVTQTGYDPTQPSDTRDIVRQNDEYQRATQACLVGRGYSVR
jgi:hypothetical protein